MALLTIVIPSARSRVGPTGASIELKAGVAVASYQWAHGERHLSREVLRIGKKEGRQSHTEGVVAQTSDSGISGLILL
jgi:hypothetical protein